MVTNPQAFRDVKAALIRAGVSQREIAQALSINPSTVHKVLRGQCVSARVRNEVSARLGFDPWQDPNHDGQDNV